MHNPTPTVEIVYAGGTISSLVTAEGYRIGGHAMDLVEELTQRVPDFEEQFNIGQREVAYTGLSENMEPTCWNDIHDKVVEALDRDPRGVLVTHGTESMEQTARYLNEKLKDVLIEKGAKIILTGANDDISMPETDAWDNLQFGLECIIGDAPPGVYIAFHGKLILAEKAVKKPFDYEHDRAMIYIENDDPKYFIALKKQKEHDDSIIAEMEATFDEDPANSHVVEYAVNVIRPNHDEFLEFIASQKLSAVLLRLYHGGTANTENPSMDVAKLVDELRKDKGIVFFAATENGEPVDLHAYETSVKMRQAGVVPLYNMPLSVALAKLRLIDPNITGSHLIKEMLTNKAGEIDEARIVAEDISQLVELYDAA